MELLSLASYLGLRLSIMLTFGERAVLIFIYLTSLASCWVTGLLLGETSFERGGLDC